MCGASVSIVARRRPSRAFSSAARLGDGAAAHQRLALRQAIGEEQVLVTAVVVLVRAGRDQEVARDDVGALVDELVEGVLAVGARLAEDDRPGRAHHRRAVERDPLAVDLHVELLEIGGEALEPLVVGQHRVGRVAQDVAVPDADQRQDHRHVLLERRRAEMIVHRRGRRRGRLRKLAGPMAIISGRPIADQIE